MIKILMQFYINKTKNKTSVLIIEKHIFTDDIEQSLIKHSEVSVYSIPRAILNLPLIFCVMVPFPHPTSSSSNFFLSRSISSSNLLTELIK